MFNVQIWLEQWRDDYTIALFFFLIYCSHPHVHFCRAVCEIKFLTIPFILFSIIDSSCIFANNACASNRLKQKKCLILKPKNYTASLHYYVMQNSVAIVCAQQVVCLQKNLFRCSLKRHGHTAKLGKSVVLKSLNKKLRLYDYPFCEFLERSGKINQACKPEKCSTTHSLKLRVRTCWKLKLRVRGVISVLRILRKIQKSLLRAVFPK